MRGCVCNVYRSMSLFLQTLYFALWILFAGTKIFITSRIEVLGWNRKKRKKQKKSQTYHAKCNRKYTEGIYTAEIFLRMYVTWSYQTFKNDWIIVVLHWCLPMSPLYLLTRGNKLHLFARLFMRIDFPASGSHTSSGDISPLSGSSGPYVCCSIANIRFSPSNQCHARCLFSHLTPSFINAPVPSEQNSELYFNAAKNTDFIALVSIELFASKKNVPLFLETMETPGLNLHCSAWSFCRMKQNTFSCTISKR